MDSGQRIGLVGRAKRKLDVAAPAGEWLELPLSQRGRYLGD